MNTKISKKIMRFVQVSATALLLVAGGIGSAHAQIYTTTATTTPGVPTTAGGDITLNIALLAGSLLAVAGGVWYAQRARVSVK